MRIRKAKVFVSLKGFSKVAKRAKGNAQRPSKKRRNSGCNTCG